MAIAPQRQTPRMSVDLFRAFYATRPDEERWELIDGAAIMMTPPTVAHQVIAGNLQILLYRALEVHAPAMTVCQRLGINIGSSLEGYDPEPDVAVIDADAAEDPERRYVDRFYLAAEVVSASDRAWAAKKREIYKLHATCTCILTIQQDRFEVCVDLRTSDGWRQQILTAPEDPMVLIEFGLRCKVADLYAGTALRSPKASR
jgi:Uma2 family endonuclease